MKKVSLDDDTFELIKLLLRKQAEDCSDFQRYGGNIQSRIVFDISNRGLRQLNCVPVEAKEYHDA